MYHVRQGIQFRFDVVSKQYAIREGSEQNILEKHADQQAAAPGVFAARMFVSSSIHLKILNNVYPGLVPIYLCNV